MSAGEQRAGVELTNLDQPLSPDALATKRDLVDYLDAVADRMLPGLVGRPLTVLRVLRGQAPFMQKNAPKYTPDWVKTVPIWAEASKREVRYPLCDDRRTLLWLANQRAVEYHPSLGLADNIFWVSTQLEGIDASVYRTRIILKPENIVPNFDLSTGKH